MSAVVTTGYLGLVAEAHKPLADRKRIVQGRKTKTNPSGRVIPRKMDCNQDELTELAKLYKDGDKFPNPHNKTFYFYAVEALKQLGLDKRHKLSTVKDCIRDLA